MTCARITLPGRQHGIICSGLGVATPLTELLDNYRRLVAALPAVIQQHPTALVVRGQVGNLSVVVENPDGTLDSWGWINVRTGEINLADEPWPIEEATR